MKTISDSDMQEVYGGALPFIISGAAIGAAFIYVSNNWTDIKKGLVDGWHGR